MAGQSKNFLLMMPILVSKYLHFSVLLLANLYSQAGDLFRYKQYSDLFGNVD